MRKVLLFLLFICFLSSCVPNKNLIYLQGEPVSLKEIRETNDAPYKLQVHDNISIDIKADEDKYVKLFQNTTSNSVGGGANIPGQTQGTNLFTGYSVDRYGNIRIPYLGEINVLGYTTREVREKIEEKLKDYLTEDVETFVTVRLNGFKYTIMGEVGSPGQKIVYQNQLSILDAITNAGDITVVGNRKNVQVIRSTATGVQKFEIDLTRIDALNSDIFFIKPNDYINVMPLRQKSWGTGTTGLQTLTTIVSIFTLVTSTILIVRGL
ncbi:polysaccharide biosynthesis/export family protein [Pseudotenacibaculum sp. MALMAid0570]|uniref:polysaccharide biosynthesis/export family protein n=1 Tax=Pseudotenacibaculum sp. MALMAid0570 TaxID=3143938 RepID=UPI0032E043E0